MALVLVVDDDSDLRTAIQDVLEEEGHDARPAKNGRDALDQLDAGLRPDLIVLDMMMPVMTGSQFLDELATRKELSEIPVLVMSAGKGWSPFGAGVRRSFMAKPFDLHALLDAVTSVIGG